MQITAGIFSAWVFARFMLAQSREMQPYALGKVGEGLG